MFEKLSTSAKSIISSPQFKAAVVNATTAVIVLVAANVVIRGINAISSSVIENMNSAETEEVITEEPITE